MMSEEIAHPHLEKIGVVLTKLTDAQAAYLGVDVNGPEKKRVPRGTRFSFFNIKLWLEQSLERYSDPFLWTYPKGEG